MYRRTGQLVTIGVILFCAALLPSVGRAPQHAVAAVSLPLRWVELGPGGRLIVRTVDREGGPQLRVAGRAINLTVRARPSSEFPITVCEAMLPSGIGSSSHGLPLLTGPRDGSWSSATRGAGSRQDGCNRAMIRMPGRGRGSRRRQPPGTRT